MEPSRSEDPVLVQYGKKVDNDVDDDIYPDPDNEIKYGDTHAHIDKGVADMLEDNLSDMGTDSNPEQVHHLCL